MVVNNDVDSLVQKFIPVTRMALTFLVKEVGVDFATYLEQEHALKRTVDQVGTQIAVLQAIQPVAAVAALAQAIQ